MGGFPQDEAKAFSVISWVAAAAVLAKATKVIVKTRHEAMGVPTKEANAQGLRTTKQLTSMLKDQSLVNIPAVVAESNIIIQETECILKRVEDLGKGDWAVGAVAAFAAGVIDIPFAPSKFNYGKVMPARDNSGAVRFLAVGNIPLAYSLLDFHRSKLEERAQYERRPVSFQMVIDDVYAIGKGFLVGRPV
ncbi:Glutamate mutase epsilon subunit [bioreactor metagenome]|uniref:Glutamate mutase epsilon subunit n=1 Tax=bioreactor metagenome TaxID=1076179 RepID=A0A645GZ66_9ZZZZ